MLDIGFKYEFGELKAGDKFAYLGGEYEKISGCMAVNLSTDKVEEFGGDIKVYLYEVG